MTDMCRECGDAYEVNPRLNDGYCDGCRAELNAESFDDTDGRAPETEPERMVLKCDLLDCVMPGYHFPSECHTAEMIEAWEEQAKCP